MKKPIKGAVLKTLREQRRLSQGELANVAKISKDSISRLERGKQTGKANRTLDALARHGVTWTTIPYAAMHKNGGGIHCSTTPLRRDKV